MKRLTLFLLLGSLSLNVSYGQDSLAFNQLLKKIENSTYYDSLKVYNFAQEAINIAKKKGNLGKISLIYQYYGTYNYYIGEVELSKGFYKKSIKYAKKIPDSTLINASKIRMEFFRLRKNDSMALQNFLHYYAISKQRGDTQNMIISLNGVAFCYQAQNQVNLALQNFLKAYGLATKSKNYFFQGMLKSNIGLLNFQNQQYNKALQDFRIGIEAAKKANNIRLSFNLQHNIGLVYEKLGMLHQSIAYFRHSLRKANKLGFPSSIAVTHLNLANSYNKNEEPNLAILHADSAFFIFKNHREKRYIARPFLIQSKSYLIKGDLITAQSLSDSALYYADKFSNFGDILKAFKLKSSIYKLEGEYKKALSTYSQYVHLKDSANRVNNQKQFAELQVKYETQKKEVKLKEERSRIAILKKDSRLFRSRVFNIVIVSIVFVILLITFFYIRSVLNKRRQQHLFNQQLIKNIDSERSRIAKDLHDDIGQSLSVAKSKINLYNKGEISEIENMEKSLGNIIQQVRDLSHNLHPSFLEKIGLKRSIISLLDQVEKDTNLITSHQIDDKIDSWSLMQQNQLYRILQECVNNTVKHANAKSIRLEIREEKNNIIYLYRDNGKGLNTIAKDGFGISTMKERAKRIKGQFTIQSHPKKGMQIAIKLPK